MFLAMEGRLSLELLRTNTSDVFVEQTNYIQFIYDTYCGGLLLRGGWFIIIHDFIFPDTAVSLYSVLLLPVV